MTATELTAKVARRIKGLPIRLRSRVAQKLLRSKPHLMARIVRIMAETGATTDECLKHGALPMMVHFYSPVPDIEDLKQRGIWQKKSAMAGIDFRPDAQLAELRRLGKAYGEECDWPMHATANRHEFYTHNNSFGFGCAAGLHTILRDSKPKRVIEVGSGNSSLVIAKALALNLHDGLATDYTIIDPYPRDIIRDGLKGLSRLLDQRVELCDPKMFTALEAGDVLFIDSSHVTKVGSDVNFLILEVLPLLKPGVIIHFHDIPMPYEYPQVYATNPKFRMFWNESYLLQAFLACNKEFEIVLAMAFIQEEHMNVFCASFPKFKLAENWANSGSLWIRRKPL